MTAELAGAGLRLRPYDPADLQELVRLVNHPEVATWWGPHDEAKLGAELSDDDLEVWTIVVDGRPAGVVEVTEETDPGYRHVALDVFLSADLHGRGLGAEALRTVLRHLFADRGHHRATIDPAVENVRAIRSYEKVGFRRVGIMRAAERAPDGRWRDSLMMDLLAADFERQEEEPG